MIVPSDSDLLEFCARVTGCPPPFEESPDYIFGLGTPLRSLDAATSVACAFRVKWSIGDERVTVERVVGDFNQHVIMHHDGSVPMMARTLIIALWRSEQPLVIEGEQDQT